MSTLETVLLSLLVLDALALTVLVLLQQGKGADVGAAFGSGSSNTMFGSGGGASFLTKATAWLAIGFFAIAFGLAYLANERADSTSTLGIPQVDEALTDVPESVDSEPVEVEAVEAAEEEFPDDIPEL
jgi:preprotein translocase subunit SecG